MFPAEPTVDAGSTLRLFVSANAAYRVRIEQWGSGAPVAETGRLRGIDAPPGDAGSPWDWPHVDVALSGDLPSGAYVARALSDGAQPPGGPRACTPDARWGTALFVVRRPPAARILINLPLFTYHAYNVAHVDGTLGAGEGDCLYSGRRSVTLRRPGGGTGGHPWDEVNADAYDRASPRQTFAHWDRKGLDWFARTGLAVDVCTDLDLHRGTVPLDAYALLCTFGHDEYWTPEKRAAVERFLNHGGNVAFFGGNTCWFRVRYDEPTMTIARDGRWCDTLPEERLTGSSFRFGGGKWIGERPPSGYRIENGEHPFIRAAGLRDGDVLGAECRLIGYEVDGIEPASVAPGTTLLARASLREWDVGDGSGEISPNGHAAMTVLHVGDGTVFNAGTTDWARALSIDHDVAALTHAIVDALANRAPTGRP